MELFVVAVLTLNALQIDSVRLSRSARDAQAEFEWTRRHDLPVAPGHGGGPCDEQIGRFCYWDEAGGTAAPPQEPHRIRESRARLISLLDTAAALLPGDEWIAGQRVRYLVEDGRPGAALAAARACRAVTWWCAALAGFALHAAGDYAGADSGFAAALRDMPPDERCRWTDLSKLLDGALGSRYRHLACADPARDAFAARLWWLAQPFYSVSGNDRRTEHFARMTMARLAAQSRTAYGVSWGADLSELTLRYGWPVYWTQAPAGPGFSTDIAITGHDPDSAFHFFPNGPGFDDPGGANPAAWTLDPPRARERYAPRYAVSIAALEHQLAMFRRGDSCLAVGAYDIARDTLFAGVAPDVALVLATDERTGPVIERRAATGASDVMVGKAGCRPLLMSFEVVAPARRHAARARYGVRPPSGALSDVLLFDPSYPSPNASPAPDSLPAELAALLPYVRGATTVDPNARLGLFWEVYGLDPAGETVTTAVRVLPTGTGWLRRATQSLGLSRRSAPVRVEWTETLRPRGGIAARPLALELSGLAPGRYRIELAVRIAGREEAVVAREIAVRSRAQAPARPD